MVKISINGLLKEISRDFFSVFYIFIGLFSSVLYFRRKLNEYLAFGILSLSTGFFYISSRVTGIQHLLFYSDTFWLYLAISSLSLIPVGIFWLLYHLLIKTKRIILLLLRIHIIYFISTSYVFLLTYLYKYAILLPYIFCIFTIRNRNAYL